MNTPAIETPRLLLRRFTPQDTEAFYRIMADEQANTFLPWFPVKSAGEAERLLHSHYLPGSGASAGLRYAVCLGQTGNPIGYVTVGGGDSHDFGYGLRHEYWRQGFATEACRAVVAQLRLAGVPFITATHDVNNPKSGGVMKRIGMSYRYSYEEQWQPKNIPVTFRMYQLNLDGDESRVYMGYWNRYPVHFVETLN